MRLWPTMCPACSGTSKQTAQTFSATVWEAAYLFQVAIRHPEQVRRLIILSGTYANDGWWPDVKASFSTITADMFKGSPIQTQYESFGNDPEKFPDFVKKVISINTKPYKRTSV